MLTINPVGATGDSAPACAPLPTMMAIRNGGMLARAATVIAIGPSIAAVEMLPGPIEAIAAPSRKKVTGINPLFPRHSLTAACARRSS